jgi:flagellar motor component MotA
MLFYAALLVGLVYAVAAFALRNAPRPVARILWGLTAVLVVAAGVLVAAMVRNPALARAVLGPFAP